MLHSPNTRYPGSRPFSDTVSDRQVFFGREAEVESLVSMIQVERLVVLYARSGIGKTSLINAGIKEQLRLLNLAPLTVRLNDARKRAPEALMDGVMAAAHAEELEWEPPDRSSLWSFFKTLHLWKGDVLQTPVLVLDQFEELFTLNSDESRQAFIDQFADLVRGRFATPDEATRGLTESAPPVRILIAIREDFLGRLEELASRVPSILNTRFRLVPFSRAAARRAIEKPASAPGAYATPIFQLQDAAVVKILDFLSARHGVVSPSHTSIEPFQLQLVCEYVERQVAARAAAPTGQFDPAQPPEVGVSDLGGDAGLRSMVFDFYARQLQQVGAIHGYGRLVRLCEVGLINAQGRRLSLEREDIHKRFGVSDDALNDLVERRVLRCEPRLNDTVYYELSHDTLVEPVLETRRRRNRRRRRDQVWALAAAAVLMVAAGVWWWAQQRARDSVAALLSSSRAEASRNVPQALQFAAAAVGESRDLDGAPSSDAQLALATALAQPWNARRDLAEEVLATALGPSGDIVATATMRGTLKLTDRRGEVLAEFPHNLPAAVHVLTFSADGTRVAAGAGRHLGVWRIDGHALSEAKDVGGAIALLEPHPSRRVVLMVAQADDGLAISEVDLDGESDARIVARLKKPLTGLSLDPQGVFAAGITADGAVLRWDVTRDGQFVNEAEARLEDRLLPNGLLVLPDGIAGLTARGFKTLNGRNGDLVAGNWSSDITTRLNRLDYRVGWTISADFRQIFLGLDNEVLFFDVSNFSPDRREIVRTGVANPSALAFLAFGEAQRLAVGGRGGTVEVWERRQRRGADTTRTDTATSGRQDWGPWEKKFSENLSFEAPIRTLQLSETTLYIGATHRDVMIRPLGGSPGTIARPHAVASYIEFIGPLRDGTDSDPRYFVVGDDERRLELIDGRTGRVIRRWDYADPAFVTMSPDRSAVVFPDAQGVFWHVGIVKGAPSIRRLPGPATAGPSMALAWLPGVNAWVSAVESRRSHALTITTAEGGQILFAPRVFKATAVMLTRDTLAIGDDAGGVWTSDVGPGPVSPVPVKMIYNEAPVTALRRSTQGHWAVGDQKGRVRVFDNASNLVVDDKRSPGHPIRSLAYVAADDSFVGLEVSVGSAPGQAATVGIKTVSNGGLQLALRPDNGSNGGALILASTGRFGIRLSREEPNPFLETLDGSGSLLTRWRRISDRCTPSAVAGVPGADAILVGCREGVAAWVSPTTELPPPRLLVSGPIEAVVVSADGATGIAAGRFGLCALSLKDDVEPTPLPTPAHPEAEPKNGCTKPDGQTDLMDDDDADDDDATVSAVAMDRQGRWLAAADHAGRLLIQPWPVAAATRSNSISTRTTGRVESLSFSPDGTQLRVTLMSESVQSLDLSTRTYRVLGVDTMGIAEWTGKERKAYTFKGGRVGLVDEWDTPLTPPLCSSGVVVAESSECRTSSPIKAAFSSDGERLVISQEGATTWELAAGWQTWLEMACDRLEVGVGYGRAETACRSRRASRARTVRPQAAFAWRPDAQSSRDRADWGRHLLHHAAIGGRADMAELLIARGADVAALDDFGQTPLHYASFHGHTAVVQVLLAAGADVNVSDPDRVTPLMAGAFAGSTRVVELLLAARADVNAQDRFGKTALVDAARGGSASLELVNLLLSKGANVHLLYVPGGGGGKENALTAARVWDAPPDVIDRLAEEKPWKERPVRALTWRIRPDLLVAEPLRSIAADLTAAGAGSPEERLKWAGLSKLADLALRDPDATALTGLAHLTGIGTPPDPVQAAASFRTAARAGSVLGKALEGFALLIGEGVHQNVSSGMALLEQAGEQGNAFASWVLSAVNADNLLADAELNRAMPYAERAIQAGYPAGENSLASLITGLRPERELKEADRAKGWALFDRAYAAGDSAARGNVPLWAFNSRRWDLVLKYATENLNSRHKDLVLTTARDTGAGQAHGLLGVLHAWKLIPQATDADALNHLKMAVEHQGTAWTDLAAWRAEHGVGQPASPVLAVRLYRELDWQLPRTRVRAYGIRP